jgi:hypothetical protein
MRHACSIHASHRGDGELVTGLDVGTRRPKQLAVKFPPQSA